MNSLWRLLPVLFLLAGCATAQPAQPLAGGAWCDEGGTSWSSGGEMLARYCEVREVTLRDRDRITVDAGEHGGVSVESWDRADVLVQARVVTGAHTEADARRLAEAVELETGETVRAVVPRGGAHVSVSYRVRVPRQTALDLTTRNGGIAVNGIAGEVRFHALNGGVSLAGLGGDVRGRTTNGGLSVVLTGGTWQGRGLDVETVNGGVHVAVPEGYSADFETGTVNGHLHVGFPVTVEGEVGRRLTTVLGQGGAPIRILTTNGGVRVDRG